MKTQTRMICLGIMVFSARISFAQNGSATPAGLYETAADFTAQKISYPVNCSDGGDKIKPENFFGSSTGEVIVHGEKHVFDKSKTYGYRSCDNKNYRFYNHQIFEILDTADFCLYYEYKTESVEKGVLLKEKEYFFSAGPQNAIYPLTLTNLDNVFADNPKFRYALNEHFNSGNNLVDYDPYLKMYKIKYLYIQSVK